MDLDLPPPCRRLELPSLFAIGENPDALSWVPFKEGVDIYRLYGDGISGPTAALIRFHPGGKVPLHEHLGYEHILVLSGSQEDNMGTAQAGALIITPPGTHHRVISEKGCIVLAIYEKPVRFLEDSALSHY